MARSKKRKKKRTPVAFERMRQLDLEFKTSATPVAQRKLAEEEREFVRRTVTHPRYATRQLLRRRIKVQAVEGKRDIARNTRVRNIVEVGAMRRARDLCGKRAERRAVLHRLGRTGKGSGVGPRKITASSRVLCK